MRSRKLPALRNLPDILVKLGQKSSLVRKLFFTKRNEHTFLKGVAGFLFGAFLGLIFHLLVIRSLEFSPVTTALLGTLTGLLLALGCAFSVQMKCTCLLSLPSLCGRTGRSSLKALILASILAGPVANVIFNTKEVVRSFACTTQLAYNLTKTKYMLLIKPYKDAMTGMKADTSDVRETMNTVREVVAPIAYEVSSDEEVPYSREGNDYMDELQNNTKRSEKIEKKYNVTKDKDDDKKVEDEYLKKLEYRCEGVMSAAGSKCRKIFAKAYDDCYNAVSWVVAWALCWPMKLTFVCNVVAVLGGSDACDASQHVTPGFGKGFNYLGQAKSMVASEFKPPNVQFTFSKPTVPIDVRGAADAAQAMINDFEQKKSAIDSMMLIFKRILTIAMIRIFLDAQNYQERYLKDIQYDNIYITKYFKKIDARRKAGGKHTLLPLKKLERPGFVDPSSLKLSPTERSHVIAHSLQTIVEIITICGILIVDRLFYELLDMIRRHSKIEYHQYGQHDLRVTVDGNGVVANVVRSVIKNFNFHKKVDQTFSNEKCLPRPIRLKTSEYRTLFGHYLIIFAMVLLQGYVMRTRWIICAYFYPKREKRRVLFNYNQTLKQRIGFYKYMKKKLRTKMKENRTSQNINLFLLVRLKYPALFGWMRWFKGARRVCLICGELEAKGSEFHECPWCSYVYCAECWADIGRECWVCEPQGPASDDSNEEPAAEEHSD